MSGFKLKKVMRVKTKSGQARPETSEEIANPVDVLVMSDLATLTNALDAIAIEYTIRTEGEYKYLFVGERRDIHSTTDGKFNNFNTDELAVVTRRHKFFEFENDALVSYPNA